MFQVSVEEEEQRDQRMRGWEGEEWTCKWRLHRLEVVVQIFFKVTEAQI